MEQTASRRKEAYIYWALSEYQAWCFTESFHLILKIILWNNCYHYLQFARDKTENGEINKLAQQLGRGVGSKDLTSSAHNSTTLSLKLYSSSELWYKEIQCEALAGSSGLSNGLISNLPSLCMFLPSFSALVQSWWLPCSLSNPVISLPVSLFLTQSFLSSILLDNLAHPLCLSCTQEAYQIPPNLD